MPADFRLYLSALWIAFGMVWLAGALAVKQAARRQSASSRAVQSALEVAAFFLLFTTRLRYGPLAWRFVPESRVAAWLGVTLTAAGIALAIWARFFLGRNWSGIVTIKRDHRLVRRGPYAIVRHPIYSGLLLALLGTAVAFGEARGLAAVALALIAFRLKAGLEERFLAEQFGDEYARYRREVKAFVPYVW